MINILTLKIGQQINVYHKNINYFYVGKVQSIYETIISFTILKTNVMDRGAGVVTNTPERDWDEDVWLCEDCNKCPNRFICFTI